MERKLECAFCKQSATSVVKIGENKFIYACRHCFEVLWTIISHREKE